MRDVDDPLAASPLLASTSARTRRAILARAAAVTVRGGSWLFREGDPGDAIYVVLAGRLEAVAEGFEPGVIRALGRGAVVGELSVLTGGARSASVRARRDSTLLRIGRAALLELLDQDPRLARDLMTALATQLRRSRGRGDGPSPSAPTIALVALTPGAPVGRVTESLARELGAYTRVAQLDRPAQGFDVAAESQRLDRAEDAAGVVLLPAPAADPRDPWTALCLRQADRVLALCGDGGARQGTAPAAGLRGCDLVALDGCTPPPWTIALGARATHRVDVDSGAGLPRLARRLTARSVGIVLSGGGARAFAHIGVLDELAGARLDIDRVGGCSMGAFVGALFARGADAGSMTALCRRELVERNPWGDYTLPLFGGLRGVRAMSMLRRALGDGEIQDLERAFFCVSTDLLAGALVVHDRGPLAPAVAASMCLPGVSPPVAHEGRLLVDGGCLDNLPVETMAAAGEGPVLAVDVTARRSAPTVRSRRARGQALRALAYRSVTGDSVPRPRLPDVVFRSMVLASRDTDRAADEFAAALIAPGVERIGLRAFGRIDETVELGRQAARDWIDAGGPALLER